MAQRNRFAHEVAVDTKNSDIWIDGVHFGYHVVSKPEVENLGAGTYCVTLSVLTDSVVLDREPTPYDPDDPRALRGELDWARMRARQIVHEGMADVLHWLDSARVGYEEAARQLLAVGQTTKMSLDANGVQITGGIHT